jgi:hypothetical protein
MVLKQPQIKVLLIPGVVIALSLVLAGCARTSLPSPSLPLGTYTTTITEGDITPNISPDSAHFLMGVWELTLIEEDGYIVTKNGRYVAEGHCTMIEDLIVFTDERGPMACCWAGKIAGSYKWVFYGQILTLTSVEDQCSSRNFIFTRHPWSNSVGPE